MAYTVLARRYRSQRFDEVIGQEPISQTLKNAIKTNRVSHAYLFSGTRGVGKTTMARVLAKALNCLAVDEPTTEPCCKCESCLAINAGEDIDVIEIDGASNNGVDEVRKLRENAIYRPARARFKIYIIDEVHMLSTSAFNALLKILEEPPEHVKFIFATTEPNKVIATIQSRCQRFDFNNIGAKLIAGHLQKVLDDEKIKYDQDLVLLLAKMANGSMRDSLSLLDRLISSTSDPLTADMVERYLGCPNSEKVRRLVEEISDKNAAGTLAAVDDLIASGFSELQIVEALIDYMRDLMVVKAAGADSELVILPESQRKQVAALADKFDTAGLIYNITALEKLRWAAKSSDTARALLEASLLRLALSEHFINVDSLLSQTKATNPPLKKNKTLSPDKPKPAKDEPAENLADIDSIKNSWPAILDLIGKETGNGARGLLNSAFPTGFVDDVLTVTFPASLENLKNMCEDQGRLEKIEAVLHGFFARAVRLKFEIEAAEKLQDQQVGGVQKNAQQIRNELLNDPAVKIVLLGLGATVTGIDEKK